MGEELRAANVSDGLAGELACRDPSLPCHDCRRVAAAKISFNQLYGSCMERVVDETSQSIWYSGRLRLCHQRRTGRVSAEMSAKFK